MNCPGIEPPRKPATTTATIATTTEGDTTMTRTATELTYTNGMHLLVKYANGERALWVEEPNARDDGHASYSMNDANERIDIEPTEDIDAIVADWKHNVEWVEGTDGEDVEHYA